MDRSLRAADNNIGNPGTAADLTAAAIFVALLRGDVVGFPGGGGDDAGAR